MSTAPTDTTRGTGRRIDAALAAIGVFVLGTWFWRCICLFPAHGWNEIRLAPLFHWISSGSPYPAAGLGPTTTWMYGPVPLLLLSPALLATSAAGALLVAAVLNLAITVVAVVAVCVAWPAGACSVNHAGRWLGAAACLAVWPDTAFRFIQADNVGLACGLVSLVALARATRPAANLAALACAAALLSKQTFLGLFAAQVLWLWLRSGTAPARAFAVRVLAFTAVGLAAACALWGAENVGFHLLVLPGRQPWTASILERVATFWPQLLLHAGLPLVLLAVCRHAVFRRDSGWLLPVLAWACSWPLDAAALLKDGGSVNSLHGLPLLMPAAFALLTDRLASRWRIPVLAGLTVAAAAFHLAQVGSGAWLPRTAHLREGDALARQFAGEIYFPWHPLITYYAEHRLDEVEDGLFIRDRAGLPVARAAVHLPPRFHLVAYRPHELDWGIVRRLIPPHASVTPLRFWEVHSWPIPARAP